MCNLSGELLAECAKVLFVVSEPILSEMYPVVADNQKCLSSLQK